MTFNIKETKSRNSRIIRFLYLKKHKNFCIFCVIMTSLYIKSSLKVLDCMSTIISYDLRYKL